MFATWQVTGESVEGKIFERGLTFTEAFNRAAELKLKGWRNVVATIEGAHQAAWVVPKECIDQSEEIAALKAQIVTAEKRADEAEGREQNLIIDNANMSEAAASCLRRAEALESRLVSAEKRAEEAERECKMYAELLTVEQEDCEAQRENKTKIWEHTVVLESRLRDAEAREAATLEILEQIWHFATDDPTDLRAIAKEALTALPARSAAVLAVLDAEQEVCRVALEWLARHCPNGFPAGQRCPMCTAAHKLKLARELSAGKEV